MPWDSSSQRRAQLPPDWRRRRQAVRDRASNRCEWVTDGERCPAYGTECDHVGDHLDHALPNLRWLCGAHHKARTQIQAQDARASRRHRPAERHPGLL